MEYIPIGTNETVFEHQAGCEYCYVSSSEPWGKGVIRRIKKQHPDEVEILAENEDGSIYAKMPYKWMKLAAPRKVNMSEEAKERAREKLAENREKMDKAKMDKAKMDR